MLDIKFIRQNPDVVKESCQKKGVEIDVGKVLKLDRERIKKLKELEELRAEKNKASLEIAQAKDLKKKKRIISEMQKVDKKSDKAEKEFKKIEENYRNLMLKIPNVFLENTPIGKSEKDNVVIKEKGKKPDFDFKPKSYLEIAENLDLIDVKRAAKVSGTRFGFIKNEAAQLQFALINFVFDFLLKKSFIPVIPPVMIKPEMMEGTGHLSRGDDQEKYFIEKDKVYLIGSAEQTIVSMHAGETFQEKDLPKRYLGYSTCFRREAGSYGKDTKGIFRVHQFDKIEMFSFTVPDKSEEEHEFLLSCQEELMKTLDLPYRVIQICSGDLGFPAASAFDIETWLPSEGRYRETHTTFNDTDFQTRRLNIRFKTKDGKMDYAHALNGTAFAIGRILITIIENYQTKEGTVKVPEALWKYLNFREIKQKE